MKTRIIIFSVMIIIVLISSGCTNIENKEKALQNITEEYLNQSEELKYCARASIMINKAIYDSGELTLCLLNMGDVKLKGFEITVIYENNHNETFKYEDLEILPQTTQPLRMNLTDTLKQINVKSSQCKAASDLVKEYDIFRGKGSC